MLCSTAEGGRLKELGRFRLEKMRWRRGWIVVFQNVTCDDGEDGAGLGAMDSDCSRGNVGWR